MKNKEPIILVEDLWIPDDEIKRDPTGNFGNFIFKQVPSFAFISGIEKMQQNIEILTQKRKFSFPKNLYEDPKPAAKQQLIWENKDEESPELVVIRNNYWFPAGFFYVVEESLRKNYVKKSKRAQTIILDIPGVLVSFPQSMTESLYKTQWAHIWDGDNKSGKVVYYRERPDLHWFLAKLMRNYEIIVWSSLDKALTDIIIAYIERYK